MSPYREKYHRDLRALGDMTRELAGGVSLAIENSVKALDDGDIDLAKRVIQGDQAIDDLNLNIESLCMELLALQQPMAKDLRKIVGILKIGIDMERSGDLAVDIARVTVQSRSKISLEKLEQIPRMAEICVQMLTEIVNALEQKDANKAREITKWDYEIDSHYVRVRDQLMRIAAEDHSLMGDAVTLLMVNRHLERIGDHICNICENIVYMYEGKREHLN